MKKTILIISLAIVSVSTFAQKKVTTSAVINFDATTEADALPKAENKTVVASLDAKTGAVAFEAIVKNFSFSNPMMQEHFNSGKWLDSDKFPKASFKGKIANITAVNFKKDGTYPVDVAGDLTIHGVTKPATAKGTVVVKGKAITANSDFSVKLEDYSINTKTGGKVSLEPKITVAASFK